MSRALAASPSGGGMGHAYDRTECGMRVHRVLDGEPPSVTRHDSAGPLARATQPPRYRHFGRFQEPGRMPPWPYLVHNA
jgi:hypothetical protein